MVKILVTDGAAGSIRERGIRSRQAADTQSREASNSSSGVRYPSFFRVDGFPQFCKDCPVKEKCIRQKKTDKTPLEERVKRLYVSKYFIRQREAMERKISTEEGILLRVNRSIQSEGVFAMMKEDMNFRCFLTRGRPNAIVEWYLVGMAYNLLKLHHKIQTD